MLSYLQLGTIIVQLLALGMSLLLSSAAPAQAAPREVTAALGPEYRAGWLHRLVLGAHWREAWTTPLKIPVLDLRTFAGGLKPVRRGGGMQTKSLRFLGKDGREYK